MTEKWVRKSIHIKDITKKETYNNHDLDLFEDENGHVYIRLTHPNDTWGEKAYFYELTNAIRSLNQMELTNDEQLENISNLNLPLVMAIQHLVGELQVTIAGDTSTIFKVNDQEGTFENGVTTYAVELAGDQHEMPDLEITQGEKVLVTYETHLPDLEEDEAQHPSYILGSDTYRTFRSSTRTRLDELEEYQACMFRNSANHIIIQLFCKELPNTVSIYDNEREMATKADLVQVQRLLPNGYLLYQYDAGEMVDGHSLSIAVNGVFMFFESTT